MVGKKRIVKFAISHIWLNGRQKGSFEVMCTIEKWKWSAKRELLARARPPKIWNLDFFFDLISSKPIKFNWNEILKVCYINLNAFFFFDRFVKSDKFDIWGHIST